jgi:transcriptional regulator with XRE-family HTH domain
VTSSDFARIRALYGETQEQFGRRLGFEGTRETVERAVRRYESGQTPVVGTMAVLLALLEKPDIHRRLKGTSTERGKAKA